MKVLVTGTAGFIGFHLAGKLIERGDEVSGIDCINDYYDPALKMARLQETGIAGNMKDGNWHNSTKHSNYRFARIKLEDKEQLLKIFSEGRFDAVVNLAAQAGVRYSLTNPEVYMQSNINGFLNILEACRKYPVNHLVYASSSSVYGLNGKMPFSAHEAVDHPVSLYAASKKSNELMAHTYSHLFGIPTTGLRFFTVYGPWGRPDMALFIFTKAILEGKTIEVFNDGKMERDFTYVEDIVDGIVHVLDVPPQPNPSWNPLQPDSAFSSAPYRIFNIGNSRSVQLMEFIRAIEKELGKDAKIVYKPIQPGDVLKTWADVSDLEKIAGYKPHTPVSEGIRKFISWYREFYKV
jgi:UDP-glucuronate 4-epimerase